MDEAVARCLVLLRDVAGLWRKTFSESRVEIMARLQPFVSREPKILPVGPGKGTSWPDVADVFVYRYGEPQ